MTVANRKKRLEWAKTNINKPADFWNKVIFTDDSKFNIFRSDGKCMVWRKPNMKLQKENLCETVKTRRPRRVSVLVWDCMSAAGVGKLHFMHYSFFFTREGKIPDAYPIGCSMG